MLVSTPAMLSSYSEYSEILYVSLVPQHFLTDKEFPAGNPQVTVFAVPDSNARPLIVGIGVASEPADFEGLLELFLQNRKQPRTIATNDHAGLSEAIDSLIETGAFTGNHILNPK